MSEKPERGPPHQLAYMAFLEDMGKYALDIASQPAHSDHDGPAARREVRHGR